MSGFITMVYGLVCYGIFFCTFLYAVGFVTNFLVPKGIDTGATGALLPSLVVDALLLTLFAVQHSGMARRAFKRWWTKFISPAAERSTYVLVTSLVLILMFWQWRPVTQVVWHVNNPIGQKVIWGICALGWLTVLTGTFMINHWHLFGLSQVWARSRRREAPEPHFQTRWLYRYMRHPLMMGFLIAFWATPKMTAGHLLFTVGAMGYIVLATLRWEERDLEHYIGEPYRRYRESVPAFIPRLGHGVNAEDFVRESVVSEEGPGAETI